MPSKPTTKPSVADPLADLLIAPEAVTEEQPAVTVPDTDEDDEDEEEETSPPMPPPPTSKLGRRGFLGAAAATVVGAVAASAPGLAQAEEPNHPEEVAPDAPGVSMTPEMLFLLAQFNQLMDQRDAKLMEEISQRFSALQPPTPPVNGVAHPEPPAEQAARPGEYPPSVIFNQLRPEPAGGPVAPPSTGDPWPPARVASQPAHPWLPGVQQPEPRRQRMVAFIPKEDPYNPRQTMFRGWVNGRELRARRGQIMIVGLGTGVDWAKNGHGNCVDIAAMQGVGTVEPMNIPRAPDFSRPDTWDGLPLDGRSSVPIGAFG